MERCLLVDQVNQQKGKMKYVSTWQLDALNFIYKLLQPQVRLHSFRMRLFSYIFYFIKKYIEENYYSVRIKYFITVGYWDFFIFLFYTFHILYLFVWDSKIKTVFLFSVKAWWGDWYQLKKDAVWPSRSLKIREVQ